MFMDPSIGKTGRLAQIERIIRAYDWPSSPRKVRDVLVCATKPIGALIPPSRIFLAMSPITLEILRLEVRCELDPPDLDEFIDRAIGRNESHIAASTRKSRVSKSAASFSVADLTVPQFPFDLLRPRATMAPAKPARRGGS